MATNEEIKPGNNEKNNGPAFGSYLTDLMNGAFITPAIGIGANLGLFDLMVGFGKPCKSEDIAKAGGFKERYIREWLGLMVTGKIVDYNESEKTYSIPEYRVPFLATKGEHNMSTFMAGAPLTTEVSKDIEKCFPIAGPRGLPYSKYDNFHSWRELTLTSTFKWEFSEYIIGQIPGLKDKLEKGISVCDAGCSMGVQAQEWAAHFPNSTFLGMDIDQEALDRGTAQAKKRGLTNLTFVNQDGCNIPDAWENRFDFVTVYDVVHDVPQPKQLLKGIYRSLKPGGAFLMVEIKMNTALEKNEDQPMAPTLFGFSLFHCMPVSYYFENGEGLGTCWGVQKQREYLEEAGFTDVRLIPSTETIQAYNICKKPE